MTLKLILLFLTLDNNEKLFVFLIFNYARTVIDCKFDWDDYL